MTDEEVLKQKGIDLSDWSIADLILLERFALELRKKLMAGGAC